MIRFRFLEEFKDCKIPKPQKCLLEELASPVVFCVDKISEQLDSSDKKHCDEIVFYNTEKTTRIYCVENKEGTRTVLSEIKNQLQGGADIIEERLSASEKFSFMPVLVTPGIRRSWRIENKKHKNQLQGKVKLKSQERYIRHIKPDILLPPHSTMPPTD